MWDSIHNGYAVELKRLLLWMFCSLFRTFISTSFYHSPLVSGGNFSVQHWVVILSQLFVLASLKLGIFLLFQRCHSVFYMQLLSNTLPQRRPVENLNYHCFFFFTPQLKSWERRLWKLAQCLSLSHSGASPWILCSANRTRSPGLQHWASAREPACAFRSAETRKRHKRSTLELLW